MTFKPPKLYAITDAKISGLSHLEQVKRLIDGGATLIQLREKNAFPGDWFDDALRSAEYAREHNVTLIINDRVDIAIATKADGVHLGQEDLPVQAARKLLGPAAIIGLSTHTATQVRQALDEPIDYIAFGPVFPTKTKSNPDEFTGLASLREAVKLAGNIPIVAIGGITRRTAAEVLATGAASLAIIRDLLSDPTSINLNSRSIIQS